MAITGAKTDYFETGLLGTVFRGDSSIPATTNLYVGLWTGAGTITTPADNSSYPGDEVAAGRNYARVAVNGNFAAPAAVVGGASTISNSNVLNFGTSNHPDGWGDVTGFFVGVGNTIGAGEVLYYGTFDQKRTVSTGDSVRINIGNLTIKED